jgi:glycosyltransferase involved in cell wall biosynthesis
MPRVSIGLPVYNGENYLAEALDSLLAQTYRDFEIIVSDNASTDNTRVICKDYADRDPRIQYHRSETNKGAAWNFNNTFGLASGEYFKWAAHDDLVLPTFIEQCVAYLDRSPETVLCFARTTFIDAEGREFKEFKYPLDLSRTPRRKRFLHFVASGHIVHEVFGLIRSQVLRKTDLIGSYLGSDLVLLADLSLHGHFHQIPEILFQHREHPERSMLNPQGARDFTEWYDSSKIGRVATPYLRRAWESTRLLIRHSMPLSEKAGCLIEVMRAIKWNGRAIRRELLSLARLDLPPSDRSS